MVVFGIEREAPGSTMTAKSAYPQLYYVKGCRVSTGSLEYAKSCLGYAKSCLGYL